MTKARPVVEITAWGLLAATGYVIAYQAQRTLFMTGVPTADPYEFPRVVVDLEPVAPAVTGYVVGTGLAFVVWIVAVIRSRTPGWRAVAGWPLALSAVGYAVAMSARPSQSIDVLSYLAHGYLAATDGNPYLQNAGDVAGYPLGPVFAAQGWAPVHPQTPYGPLWTQLETLVFHASGGSIELGVLLLKAVAVASTVGAAALVWAIAHRLRPGAELTSTLGFAWCPVVVVQFGLDGHNDALAVALTLLAIWAAATGRGWLMVLALGLAGLTKFTPLIFGPPLLVLLVRRSPSPRRALLGAGVAAAVVAGLTVVLWRPWWFGWVTLDGLRYSTTPFPGTSPAGLLAQWLTDPTAIEPDPRPQLILAAVLIAVVLALSWPRSLDRTVAVCGIIAVVALALAPVYWPWYAGMSIAVLSLRPSWVTTVQTAAIAAGAVVTALLGDLGALGQVTYEQIFGSGLWWGVTVPVAVCALVGLIGWLTQRLSRRTGGRTPAMSDAGPAPP